VVYIEPSSGEHASGRGDPWGPRVCESTNDRRGTRRSARSYGARSTAGFVVLATESGAVVGICWLWLGTSSSPSELCLLNLTYQLHPYCRVPFLFFVRLVLTNSQQNFEHELIVLLVPIFCTCAVARRLQRTIVLLGHCTKYVVAPGSRVRRSTRQMSSPSSNILIVAWQLINLLFFWRGTALTNRSRARTHPIPLGGSAFVNRQGTGHPRRPTDRKGSPQFTYTAEKERLLPRSSRPSELALASRGSPSRR
jgi:hypothetical protein